MALRHYRQRLPLGLIEDDDLLYLGRLQCFGDERTRIRVVAQDVYLLALQFAHHGLDTDPAHADAGAHRVDVVAGRIHRHLGAITGFAHHLVNLDRAVVDFRDFQLEYLLDEIGVGPGQHDLQAEGGLLHFVDHGAHAVIGAIHLARRLVATRQDTLGTAQVDKNRAVALALVVAHDQFAFAVLEFGVQGILLNLAQGLAGLLLRALDRYPVEVPRVDLDEQLVAEFGIVVVLQCVLQRDLQRRIVDIILRNDPPLRVDRHVRPVVGEAHHCIVDGSVLALVRCQQRVLDCVQNQFFRDSALLNQLTDGQCHFT